VREYLFKKYGAYDKEKDLLACKTLLEIYEQTKLCNNIFPTYKTLPLACNLGNRDEDNNNRMSTPAKIDN
jgi:hypothetical protein